jgi:hypothetical protein
MFKPNVHYRIHERQPLACNGFPVNPGHKLPYCLLNTYFHTFLSYILASQEVCSLQVFRRAVLYSFFFSFYLIQWSLRWIDHSSRGDLLTVARRCVWWRNLKHDEAKAFYRAVKIQSKWVVTPRKQTNKTYPMNDKKLKVCYTIS